MADPENSGQRLEDPRGFWCQDQTAASSGQFLKAAGLEGCEAHQQPEWPHGMPWQFRWWVSRLCLSHSVTWTSQANELEKVIVSICDYEFTHIDWSSRLPPVQVDLRDRLTSNQMEVVPFASDWAIVSIGCTWSRLVLGGQWNSAVESAVRVAGVGLRLRG